MTSIVMTNLITTILSSYASSLLIILGAVIGIGVAYLVFMTGWAIITGKSNQFTSLFPRLDRAIYKPYKGYNRLRSRQWNLEHTA